MGKSTKPKHPVIKLFVEGGGDKNSALKVACQKGFRTLLTTATFSGSLPRIVACGGRDDAFGKFKTSIANGERAYLLVDSEDTVSSGVSKWEHLKKRDNWDKPDGADENSVFFMQTCMEAWIAADRKAIKNKYPKVVESKLPALYGLEKQNRKQILKKLEAATQTEKKWDTGYSKTKVSFELLGALDPETLRKHILSFKEIAPSTDDEKAIKEKSLKWQLCGPF